MICVMIVSFALPTAAEGIAPMYSETNFCSVSVAFSGSTAYCDVTINGATGTTKIDNGTITLKDSSGNTVKQWTSQSATGASFYFSKSTTGVSSGNTYTLSFSATVHRNGKTENVSGSITKKFS